MGEPEDRRDLGLYFWVLFSVLGRLFCGELACSLFQVSTCLCRSCSGCRALGATLSPLESSPCCRTPAAPTRMSWHGWRCVIFIHSCQSVHLSWTCTVCVDSTHADGAVGMVKTRYDNTWSIPNQNYKKLILIHLSPTHKGGSVGRASDSRSKHPRFKPRLCQGMMVRSTRTICDCFSESKMLCWLAVCVPNPQVYNTHA